MNEMWLTCGRFVCISVHSKCSILEEIKKKTRGTLVLNWEEHTGSVQVAKDTLVLTKICAYSPIP